MSQGSDLYPMNCDHLMVDDVLILTPLSEPATPLYFDPTLDPCADANWSQDAFATTSALEANVERSVEENPSQSSQDSMSLSFMGADSGSRAKRTRDGAEFLPDAKRQKLKEEVAADSANNAQEADNFSAHIALVTRNIAAETPVASILPKPERIVSNNTISSPSETSEREQEMLMRAIVEVKREARARGQPLPTARFQYEFLDEIIDLKPIDPIPVNDKGEIEYTKLYWASSKCVCEANPASLHFIVQERIFSRMNNFHSALLNATEGDYISKKVQVAELLVTVALALSSVSEYGAEPGPNPNFGNQIRKIKMLIAEPLQKLYNSSSESWNHIRNQLQTYVPGDCQEAWQYVSTDILQKLVKRMGPTKKRKVAGRKKSAAAPSKRISKPEAALMVLVKWLIEEFVVGTLQSVPTTRERGCAGKMQHLFEQYLETKGMEAKRSTLSNRFTSETLAFAEQLANNQAKLPGLVIQFLKTRKRLPPVLQAVVNVKSS